MADNIEINDEYDLAQRMEDIGQEIDDLLSSLPDSMISWIHENYASSNLPENASSIMWSIGVDIRNDQSAHDALFADGE
jgi:hypothetical protein